MADEAVKPNPEEPGQPNWRSVLCQRLKNEGRWKKAEQFLTALENNGVGSDEAWLRVFEDFPPFGTDAPPEIKAELAEERSHPLPKGRKRRDFRRAVEWVVDKLTLLKQQAVNRKSAPSAMAWELGQAAAANPQWFWRDIAAKYFKEEEGDGEGRFDDRGEQLRLSDTFFREEIESRARARVSKALDEVDAA